jgi:hypothetical protein
MRILIPLVLLLCAQVNLLAAKRLVLTTNDATVERYSEFTGLPQFVQFVPGKKFHLRCSNVGFDLILS